MDQSSWSCRLAETVRGAKWRRDHIANAPATNTAATASTSNAVNTMASSSNARAGPFFDGALGFREANGLTWSIARKAANIPARGPVRRVTCRTVETARPAGFRGVRTEPLSCLVVDRAGFVVVDKPAGMTSHDVVARLRRLAGTRRVGHAGTLDPMATGVLVLAVGRATRLLTYLTGADKEYHATIRLGVSTVTDDAEGEPTGGASADAVTEAQVRAGLAAQTGAIQQVPSAVSAIKINGQRAYKRVRDGAEVSLPPRPVTVYRLDVDALRREPGGLLDVDVRVACSSGTYVRAIARDLGAGLGVGGHLTALRRTRVADFTLAEAVTLDALLDGADPVPLSPAAAAARILPGRTVDAEAARVLGHGGSLPAEGRTGPYAVYGPDGALLAVAAERDGRARPQIVLATAGR
ncbi:hypothetical protein NUM_12310 [Actinocatenispora comari]|uniref:tRNA pseudouridine synthase B n=2 Tax=Actinocatenispora comari TaxID=2807577 RepID=A0A8J4AA76_9ACTN|nr:hypothetical protein NUM_12310 [Actinocatenispora comari]